MHDLLKSGVDLEKITNDHIDLEYYNKMVDKAVDTLNKFGDVERFIADEEYEDDSPPWDVDDIYANNTTAIMKENKLKGEAA